MVHWWNSRTKTEKVALAAIGTVAASVIVAASAKTIIEGGIVVVSGKTIVAIGKSACIIACRFQAS